MNIDPNQVTPAASPSEPAKANTPHMNSSVAGRRYQLGPSNKNTARSTKDAYQSKVSDNETIPAPKIPDNRVTTRLPPLKSKPDVFLPDFGPTPPKS